MKKVMKKKTTIFPISSGAITFAERDCF